MRSSTLTQQSADKPATTAAAVPPKGINAALTTALPSLPEPGFSRLKQIVSHPGAPLASPPRPPRRGYLPISAATWWKGVKHGRFPRPIKLSARCTVWDNHDLNQ